MSGITIEARDCMELMRDWKGRKADVVVTSPPYNVGKNYSMYEDNMTYDEYLQWVETWSGGGGTQGQESPTSCRRTDRSF